MYVDGCRVHVVFVAGCWRTLLVSMDLVTFWLLTWELFLDRMSSITYVMVVFGSCWPSVDPFGVRWPSVRGPR